MLKAQHITKLTRTLLPGILLFVIVAGCKNDPKEINALVTKGAQQEDKAEDVTILYSDNGHVKMKLYAKEFVKNDVAKPPYTDMRKGLKVEFFNDSMQVESTLDAKYARYY